MAYVHIIPQWKRPAMALAGLFSNAAYLAVSSKLCSFLYYFFLMVPFLYGYHAPAIHLVGIMAFDLADGGLYGV